MSRPKVSVCKVGGAVLENRESLEAFLEAFCALEGPKVLVHGGGRTATALSASLGIESRMVGGRRVTDEKTIDIVTMVYAGLVNKKVVAALASKGQRSLGLCGADMDIVRSHRRPPVEVDGEIVDFGFVGDVDKVEVGPLSSLLGEGIVPVICPITHNGGGALLNTNADTVASEVAGALSAQWDVSLYLCFEKKGVLSDPSNEDSVIEEIDPVSFERLKAEGVVSGGMLPKVKGALEACARGVGKVYITSISLEGGTLIHS